MGRNSSIDPEEADSSRASVKKKSRQQGDKGSCGHCHTQKHCSVGKSHDVGTHDLTPFIIEKSYAKGDVLHDRSTDSDVLKVLKIGSAYLVSENATWGLVPLALMGKGALLTNPGLDPHPVGVSMVASSKCRVCEVDIQALRALGLPSLEKELHLAHNGYSMLVRWSEIIRLSSIQNRMAVALLLLTEIHHSPRINITSQAELARLINSTRESVARTLSLFIRLGFIRRVDPHVYEVELALIQEWLSQTQA